MPQLPITWVDVFAEGPLQGNLLPVIHEADGIEDAVLARVARRFLQPETSFLQRPSNAEATYRHRIYAVAGELPFAGHPSLGAAAAHAHRLGTPRASIIQQTPSGNQRLEVDLEGVVGRATIEQNPAELGEAIDPAAVLAALGLLPEDAHPELPAQVGSTGLPALFLPVRSVAMVSSARPDHGALRAALGRIADPDSLNNYLVAEEHPGRWRARSFSLDLTGGEDPATGSAAGPFGAYLKHHRGETTIIIDQGVEMGSPSRLYVDTTEGIRVSGQVRITGTGVHDIPTAIVGPAD
jgi:trans-2,3-dihydro-3-hydroxyanthranilate isomerase